jgi:ribosomal protein L7/L12
MSSPKLQTVLGQLSDLTRAELSLLKAAVDEELERQLRALERQLRALGTNGDLTEEEWLRLEEEGVRSCFHMVRKRTGLGFRDTKDYIDRARARGRKLPNV